METAIDRTGPEHPVAPFSSGSYVNLLTQYTDRSELLEEVKGTLLDGIELFAGRDCRRRCEDSGLGNLHRHYPAEHVSLLTGYVNVRLKRRMLGWTAVLGRRDLGFEHDFLVQDLFVVRIHYPHGHKTKPSVATPAPSLRYRVWYGLRSNVESLRQVYESRSGLGRVWKTVEFMRTKSSTPLAYRVHGSHKDSWQGQSIGALSVWLAIAGLDRNNALCLYPETADIDLPVGRSRYLGSGCVLPKPSRPDIRDGDLLVFSTDILHSGQLNASNNTRIALTTRIDPGTPLFDPDSLWFVQRWYSANDLLRGRWRRKTIRASEHLNRNPPPKLEPRSSRIVKIPSTYRRGEVYPVGLSSIIGDGEKLAVEFENFRAVVIRNREGLRALSGKCPHGGYFLEDGYHDDRTLTCPGHGLEFDLQTGGSAAACYRLLAFDVYEKDGTIFLGAPRVTSAERAPRQSPEPTTPRSA